MTYQEKIVNEAQKRLEKRYGEGLSLLAPTVKRAMLYAEVLSPSTIHACFNHNHKGTGQEHIQKLTVEVDRRYQ